MRTRQPWEISSLKKWTDSFMTATICVHTIKVVEKKGNTTGKVEDYKLKF